MLVERGLVELDAPVARYWPEFARAGKGAITVRMLLAHRAGLPAIRTPLPDDAIYDWRAMTDALAAETPWWEPGRLHGYHVNTFGFLVGEIVRRVTGESIGAFVRREIAGPLDADFHFGVAAAEHARVADCLPDELFEVERARRRRRPIPSARSCSSACTGIRAASRACGTVNTARVARGGDAVDQRPRERARGRARLRARSPAAELRRRPPARARDDRRGDPRGVRGRGLRAAPAVALRARLPALDARAAVRHRARARSATSAPAGRSASPTPTRGSPSATR